LERFTYQYQELTPLPVIGMTPALEAESAGGMTKVPKAW
jgi:hypothetical protein